MTAIPTTVSDGPWATIGLQVRLTANETHKGVTLMWRRRGRLIATSVALSLTYLGFSMLVGGGEFVRPMLVLTLPGLLALTVAEIAALQGSGGIAEEVNGGTLEQSQLGPASQRVHILGRLAALAVEGLLVAAALGTVFSLAFQLNFGLNPSVLLPALFTVADALGYGLLMTALTLRFASIGAILHVFNMTIMFFGGMLLPVTVFPDVMHTVARFIPTTLGVEASNTILSGQPLSATWTDGTLPWLIVHTTVLFALGWAIYTATIRRARREGGLSPQ